MSDGFKWALAQNLGYRLCAAFHGFPEVTSDKNNCKVIVKGKLNLGSKEMASKARASCCFTIDGLWTEKTPAVECSESWLHIHKEWHAFDKGSLCWEFDEYWKDSMAQVVSEVTHGQASEFASIWLLRSVRNLLNRHLFAHRSGISEWRKEWDYWAHERAAAQEYLKLIRTLPSAALVSTSL
jgi:hypothetical protein